MDVKVKICGLTSRADALTASEAGADLIGLMFYEKSPRCVTLETAREIARALPPHVVKVGVFVDSPAEMVSEAVHACGLNMLQFHGAEAPDFCTQFGVMSIKAFRVRDESILQELANYRTDGWLLDAYVPDQLGGTGATFNWNLALEAKKLGRPIFLAGGLSAENVAEAVQRVRPFGVDVSSGVESSPGKKDPQKVQAFIRAAKSAG